MVLFGRTPGLGKTLDLDEMWIFLSFSVLLISNKVKNSDRVTGGGGGGGGGRRREKKDEVWIYIKQLIFQHIHNFI